MTLLGALAPDARRANLPCRGQRRTTLPSMEPEGDVGPDKKGTAKSTALDSTAESHQNRAGDDDTEFVRNATQTAPELAWSSGNAGLEPVPYRQPWARAWLIAAAILVPLAVLASAIAIPRWISSHQNSSAPSATKPNSRQSAESSEPHGQVVPKDLAAATAAAQEKTDRHTSGDFAGEWLLYTKRLRDGITQQNFVHYSEVCSPTGFKLKAIGVRMDGADRAIVRIEALGAANKAFTWAYEDGAWYQVPDDFLTSNLGKTGDQLIAQDKAHGHCQS